MIPARATRAAVLLLGLAFVVIQWLPYGRDHGNPPAGSLVSFDTPTTEDLARRACFDCHSNSTQWPWYASVAPISWRIQSHVQEGRAKLNFSDFNPSIEKVAHAAGEAGESVTKGEMPPRDYLLMHSEARLTQAERARLAQGLDASFAAFVQEGHGGGSERERESGEAENEH